MSEPIFTPEQIAEELQVSKRMIQDMFREEKGVIRFGNLKRGRRARTLIRIPKTVKDRVLARFLVTGGAK